MSKVRFTRDMKRRILVRMRTRIRRGWVQGAYYGMTESGKPGVCLLGAMRQSLLELYPEIATQHGFRYDELSKRISLDRAVRRRGYKEVYTFNDDPKTRKADVLRLLDKKIGELA